MSKGSILLSFFFAVVAPRKREGKKERKAREKESLGLKNLRDNFSGRNIIKEKGGGKRRRRRKGREKEAFCKKERTRKIRKKGLRGEGEVFFFTFNAITKSNRARERVGIGRVFCPCTFGTRKSVLPRQSEAYGNDSLLALSRGQVGSLAIPMSSTEIKSCNWIKAVVSGWKPKINAFLFMQIKGRVLYQN